MLEEEIKKQFIIPYVNIEDNNSYWERKPAISFYNIKNMLGIDLLKFKKIGSSILINAKSNTTLDFRVQWIIFNGKPFLTNVGMLILFNNCKKIYNMFIKKYSRFLYTNKLAKELNDLLEFKKRSLKIEEEDKKLKLKKLEEETGIHINYIKEFIPNF